jgi:hypothetical protein
LREAGILWEAGIEYSVLRIRGAKSSGKVPPLQPAGRQRYNGNAFHLKVGTRNGKLGLCPATFVESHY